MRVRSLTLKLHRWISLACATLWLLQAVTGLLIVFHWEIDDLTIPGAHQPTDLAAIDRTAKGLTPVGSGRVVASIWNTAGRADRYNIFINAEAPEAGLTVTVDGAGTILRTRADGEAWANGGWMETIISLHHNLLLDDMGSWIIGVSGCLLFSNIALGLTLGWPKLKMLHRALKPSNAGPPMARHYSWHRAMGIWVTVPALFSIAAGTMLVFADGVESAIHAPVWSIDDRPGSGPYVPMPQAAQTAMRLYPVARISGIRYPDADNALYRFRLRQPGEDARAYGQTTVYTDAVTGRVVGNFDGLAAPATRRFANGLFAFHTGEIGGVAGRIAVFMIGLWLATMIILGILLWNARRKRA